MGIRNNSSMVLYIVSQQSPKQWSVLSIHVVTPLLLDLQCVRVCAAGSHRFLGCVLCAVRMSPYGTYAVIAASYRPNIAFLYIYQQCCSLSPNSPRFCGYYKAQRGLICCPTSEEPEIDALDGVDAQVISHLSCFRSPMCDS